MENSIQNKVSQFLCDVSYGGFQEFDQQALGIQYNKASDYVKKDLKDVNCLVLLRNHKRKYWGIKAIDLEII
ncbi:5721_t:CDS:2 [Entrophospora sp. SA101]|nr:5721_t:CDS:2 [Entrophospora sp. SA101]